MLKHEKQNLNDLFRSNNYLQLLYREVKGILPYQGFPRPFLSTKHTERSEGCLLNKIGRGIRWLSKTIISRKSSCTKVYRFLR